MHPKVHLSVSQIKTFIKSKQQRAGKYILGIEDEPFEDSRTLWIMFHKRIEEMNWDFTKDTEIAWRLLREMQSKELSQKTKSTFVQDTVEAFEILRRHFLASQRINALEWLVREREKPLSETISVWQLYDQVKFKWYVDSIGDDFFIDYKSVTFFTNLGDTNIPMRAWMPVRREYELQAWLYMRATGKNKALFIECLKKDYKKYSVEQGNQIIEFNYSEARDQEMRDMYDPIMTEIIENYEKHEVILDNFGKSSS